KPALPPQRSWPPGNRTKTPSASCESSTCSTDRSRRKRCASQLWTAFLLWSVVSLSVVLRSPLRPPLAESPEKQSEENRSAGIGSELVAELIGPAGVLFGVDNDIFPE